MKSHYIPIFFFIILFFLVASSKAQSPQSLDFISKEKNNSRRILHQPLFPSTPSPSPPPPPPSPPPPASPGEDQPFFHELPHGPVDPDQLSPPPPATTAVANSVAKKEPNSIKKVAIVASSTILAVGMLSALVFFIYKRRGKHPDESRKLVGNSHRDSNESRMPPSTFLYIGTVEPSATNLVNESTTDAAGSPYRKLNPGKRSSRYRPSPDLQPLPPLPKPPPPPSINSPPPMSSSDDDSHDTNFYTPQGSSMSNESPSSRYNYNYLNNVVSQVNQTKSDNQKASVPHSKRTSPKSRLSASSPPVIIPSIKPPSPPPPPPPAASSLGPFQPSKPLSYAPKRAKFAALPPALDMARLRSIADDDQPPIPIPPPPPPPQPSKLEKHTPPPPLPKKVISPVRAIDESDKDVGSTEGSKPKLKPLHWDKVRATSDRVTVWDQLSSSSFQLNEDAMESLFGCNSANSASKEGSRKLGTEQEMRVLDPKKSQNIAILLRALNVTKEEVADALLDGNPEGLGAELLETLVKMAPTKEEEIKLKDCNGEITKLGSAERFLKAILDVPFAFRRVEAMLYRANFDTELAYLRNSFQTLEEASEELKNSRLFLRLLEAVLRTGNRMNDGTNRGDARAFKLDTLLKLVDVKGTDGKTTLLHFVVQEIIRSQGGDSDPSYKFKEDEFKKQGLEIVLGLSKELGSVKKAAGMDSDVLSSYVSKLEMGLERVRLVMQQHEGQGGKFMYAMGEFLKEAGGEISRIKSEERKALSHVKEVTEYFHGDAAKEEAHPFRIFVIVRDFLSILDNVCKDVGRMQVSATMGAGRSFRMPSNTR